MIKKVIFVSARNFTGIGKVSEKAYDFTVAKCQCPITGIMKINIEKEDLQDYERGKAYFAGLHTDSKGNLKWELGLEWVD